MNKRHLASSVVMVPPIAFQYNTETGQDNEFQQQPLVDQQSLKESVMAEFMAMSKKLSDLGVGVIEFDNKKEDTPDAVFPNNWFSTDTRGNLYLYPMLCANRQREVLPNELICALEEAGFVISRTVDFRGDDAIFEGTGALIIDHQKNIGFCALSQRADKKLVNKIRTELGLNDIVCFNTQTSAGLAVYHTNVLMSVGPEYTIVCSDVIAGEDRGRVLDNLGDKVIVEITESQMQQFCGNVLQLQTKTGSNLIVMSESAYNAFTKEQLEQLSQCGDIHHFNVDLIEKVGGGSVRCMLAEVFLSRQQCHTEQ